MRFSKCEFLDKLSIFAPVCKSFSWTKSNPTVCLMIKGLSKFGMQIFKFLNSGEEEEVAFGWEKEREQQSFVETKRLH